MYNKKVNREVLDDLAQFALENSNFEDETLEDLENVVGARYGAAAKQQFKNKMMQKRFGGNSNVPAKPFGGASPKGFTKENAASFTINLYRAPAAGTGALGVLPVPIFGALDSYSAFFDVITPSLKQGVALTACEIGAVNGAVANSKVMKLTYSDGTNTDIVTVECTQNNYPALLHATAVDMMKLGGIRYGISNTTNVAQFDNEIKVVKRSLTGRQTNDSLTPSQYKSPNQFQTGIIDISEQFSIDKETSIVVGIGAYAAFTVSLNCYAAKLDKFNYQTQG